MLCGLGEQQYRVSEPFGTSMPVVARKVSHSKLRPTSRASPPPGGRRARYG